MKLSRKTKQKKMLSEHVKRIDTFFNAEYLLEEVQKKNQNISIATIYRFLNEEVKKGNLFRYVCEKTFVYSKEKQHCHFKCQKTGEMIHIDIDSLDFLKKKIPGSIMSVQIEVVGICNDCSNKVI